jgi:tetratricopeptide (TPR) repeat protein
VKSPDGLRDIWLGFYRDPAKGGALVVKTYQYYPLVFTSLWIDHRLFGLDPMGYHVVNVLLHLANAGLVLLLARRLAIPGAGFVAALFAVHPMMVESVAWVAERKNVLSGLFYLAAFLAYLRFDGDGRLRWYGASFALFLCALLSKTVTATLPLALLLAVWWRRGRVELRDVARVIPFLVVAIVLGWLAVHLEQYAVGAYRAEFHQTLFERLALIAPRAFAFYAIKAVWPHPITFIYPRFEPTVDDPVAYGWLVAAVGGTTALFVLRRRMGIGPLLLVVYAAVTLAPALGLVPVFPHRYSWVADHFAYLGILGFFALATAAALEFARRLVPVTRAGIVPVLGAIVLAACAALSHHAAGSYHDEETLWTDTLAESPDAWIAMINLGVEYMEGTPRSEEHMAAALDLFRRAERHELARVQAITNQGVWHRRQGDYDAAADAFRRALALEPRRTATRRYLASLRLLQVRTALDQRRRDRALEICVTATSERVADARLMELCGPLTQLEP